MKTRAPRWKHTKGLVNDNNYGTADIARSTDQVLHRTDIPTRRILIARCAVRVFLPIDPNKEPKLLFTLRYT